MGEPRYRLGGGLEGIEVELAVAVGAEVEAAVQPHRVGVVAAAGGLGDLLHRVGRGVEEEEARDGASPVVLPFVEGLVDGQVGDGPAVGRDRGLHRVGDGEAGGHPALHRHREQLEVPVRVDLAGGGEEDGLAVGGEAAGGVVARMPGQPPGDPALRRDHVDVGVPVVAAGEGDEPPVGREMRARLDAGMRREPLHAAAVQARDPEVVRVGESDPIGAHRGVAEEPRVVHVHRARGRRQGEAEHGQDGGLDRLH